MGLLPADKLWVRWGAWALAAAVPLLGAALALRAPASALLLLAGALVGIGLCLASLRGRLPLELCFLAFVALMPATRFSLFEAGFSFQASYLALLTVLALLVLRAGVLGLPLRLPRSRVHAPILALLAVIALSLLLSAQAPPGEYRGEVRYLRSAKQIAYFLLMLLTYATVLLTVRNRRLFVWAVSAYIAGGALVALYGLYQFIAYPLGLPFWSLFPESSSFGAARVWSIALAGGSFLRVWSVASEPVWLGDFLVGVIPLTGALALQVGGRWGRRLIAAAALMLLTLLLTFTRSAYLALFAGVVVVLIFRPRLLSRAVRIGGSVVVVVALLGVLTSQLPFLDQASLFGAVSERFLSPFQDENFGNIHRTTAITTSWNMFLDRPWGVGYGNFGFFYYDYVPSWGRSTTDTQVNAFPVMSGNIFLRLLTETSVPGALAFLWLIVAVTREGIRAQRWLAGDPFLQTTTIGLLAGFLTLMTRLQMADSFHFTYQWFVIALIVAAGWLAQRGDAGLPADEVA